jgi:hypothetical protein
MHLGLLHMGGAQMWSLSALCGTAVIATGVKIFWRRDTSPWDI